jgi:thiol-disulfide isomerase/thioredoxin
VLILAGALLAACKPTTQAAPTPTTVAAAPATGAAPATPETPRPKPEFPTLKVTTFDGKAYDLAEHRGHWVVVNFWATWCTPCLAEIPDLAAFDKARDDVDVIGLAYEEIERPDMEAFLKQHPIPYPFAVLDVYKPPADFDTPPGLPMTYLIAPDGKVAKQFLGPTNAKELGKLIQAATGTKPAA